MHLYNFRGDNDFFEQSRKVVMFSRHLYADLFKIIGIDQSVLLIGSELYFRVDYGKENLQLMMLFKDELHVRGT